jgi:SPP1 gp7 family putative phage head morphogenesis protein
MNPELSPSQESQQEPVSIGGNYQSGRPRVWRNVSQYMPRPNQRVIPLFETGERASFSARGEAEPIGDEDIEFLLRRDEIANASLNRLAGAVFNKWLTPRAEDKALATAIEDLLNQLKAKTVLKAGYILAKVYGYCVISLGLEDGETDLSKEPISPKGIAYLHALSKKIVREIKVDKDPNSKTYGQILSYKIVVPQNEGTAEIAVNAKRAIHWINPWIDGNPEGLSMFEPLWDKYLIKRNMDYAVGQTLYRNAKPWPTLEVPGDADEEEVDDAETNFAEINVRSWFIIPPGYKFSLVGTNNALNPEPYLNYMMTTLAAGSIGSKVGMFGTEAGAVTGSEININEKYAYYADEQSNFVEPVLIELVKRCQAWGVLPAGRFWFEWNTLWELDEQDMADIELKKAQAFQAFSLGLATMRQQGFEIDTEAGEIILTLEGEPITVPGLNSIPTRKRLANNRRFGVAISRKGHLGIRWAMNARAPGMPDFEHDKLFGKSEIPTKDLENRWVQNFMAHLVAMRAEFFERLRHLWEQEIGVVDLDPTAPVQGAKQDSSDLYSAMDGWEPADLDRFKADIIKFLTDAYKAGDYKALQDLGVSLPKEQEDFKIDDKAAARKIEVEGERLAKQTYLDNHKGAMNEISNGIRAGETYAQISDRLASKFAEYDGGIPNTVQKFVHTVSNEARIDEMMRHGVTKFVYLTARDERVRPEHAALDSRIMTREEAMPYLSEFGCRCTLTPITVYDEALQEMREEEEQGLKEAG